MASRHRSRSTAGVLGARVSRLLSLVLRGPLDPETLHDPIGLLVTDLDDLEGHVTSLSCGKERGMAPRLVPLERFVADATVVQDSTPRTPPSISEPIAP